MSHTHIFSKEKWFGLKMVLAFPQTSTVFAFSVHESVPDHFAHVKIRQRLCQVM